jgi:hypothetical protein
MSTARGLIQRYKSLCFASVLFSMASPAKAELPFIIFNNRVSYCFSGSNDAYAENLFHNLVRMERLTPERNLSFFGRLAEFYQGETRECDSLDLLPSNLKQTCLRMGLIQPEGTGMKFNIRFCIDLVIYRCAAEEGYFRRKTSTLVFPNLTTLPINIHYPFVFFGKGLSLNDLYDDTEESRGSGFRARSLPFGVRLLSSSHPTITHKNVVMTYCYIPAFQQRQPIFLQTIHYFPSREKIISLLSTPDLLLEGLMSNCHKPKMLKILRAAKDIQNLALMQRSLCSTTALARDECAEHLERFIGLARLVNTDLQSATIQEAQEVLQSTAQQLRSDTDDSSSSRSGIYRRGNIHLLHLQEFTTILLEHARAFAFPELEGAIRQEAEITLRLLSRLQEHDRSARTRNSRQRSVHLRH